MIARNICPIHEGVAHAAIQPIPDAAAPEHNTLAPWLFDHGPLILGSVLGMFASNIFLYAFRNGGLRAIVRVSLHFLSSLPGRIHLVATAVPRSVYGTYLWTSQLSRHIYLLALCAFCQAVILPCLVVSQLIGWAGLAWFGALRVLYSALRIVSKVGFDVLVVSTGLYCAVVVASKVVTSCLRRMWGCMTDLHDAAVAFVGGTKSTPSSVNSHRTNEQPEDSSSASPSHLTAHPSIGTPCTSARPRFNPGPSRTKKGATTVDFVIAYEVDVTHEGSHCRFPIRTSVRLRLALSDQLQSGTIDSLESPAKVDVTRPNETDDVWNRFDDGSIEPRKDLPDGGRTRPREEAIEEKEERLVAYYRKLVRSSVAVLAMRFAVLVAVDYHGARASSM
ncbi:hypothetical protein V8D89_002647 [Ganoderma adspersum]